MRILPRSLSFAAVFGAVLALTVTALPASATTQAARSAPAASPTVEHATLVCVKGGFAAAFDVSVRRQARS